MNNLLNKSEESKRLNRTCILLSIIILSSFIFKLPWIDKSIYTVVDSARQVHTAAITRDLSRNNFNIFDTEIYYDGAKAKFIQEFPLYNLIVAFSYKIFGEEEVLGKIFSSLFFIMSLYFLFLLLRFYLTVRESFISVFIFSFSYVCLLYTDFFQPTGLNILLIVLHFYFLHKYLEEEKTKYYLLWLLFGTLNFLVKPVFLVLLLPIFYLLWNKYGRRLFNLKNILYFIISLGATGAWYYYAFSTSSEKFFGYDQGFVDPFVLFSSSELSRLHFTNYFPYLIRYFADNFCIPAALMIPVGMFLLFRKKKYLFLTLTFAALFIQLLLLPFKIIHHQHYLLPICIPLSVMVALVVSAAIEKFNKGKKVVKIAGLICLVLFFGYFVFHTTSRAAARKDMIVEYMVPLAERIKSATGEESKILFIGDRIASQYFVNWEYATDRPGWRFNLTHKKARSIQSTIIRKGATEAAVIQLTRDQRKRISPPPLRNWFFAKYPLKDSFRDAYYMFDTTVQNRYLAESYKSGELNLKYGDRIVLRNIIFSNGSKGKGKTVYIWKSGSSKNRGNYHLVMISATEASSFVHFTMRDTFPMNLWDDNKTYVEYCSGEAAYQSEADETQFYYPVLYDPVNDTVLEPEAVKESRPVILADFKKLLFMPIDEKAIISNGTDGKESSRLLLLCMNDKDLLKSTVRKLYISWRSKKNDADRKMYDELKLDRFYKFKELD